MDAVYIYKRTSGDELLYSVRLLQKNVKDLGTIWVIGDVPPESLRNDVRHVNYTTRMGKFADQMAKLTYIVREPELSEDFILMMDDVYILSLFKPEVMYDQKYPTLRERIVNRVQDQYRASLEKTEAYLEENDLNTVNYELHIPVVMNREKAVVMTNNLIETDFDLQIKSLYYNFYPIDALGAVATPDVKNIPIKDATRYLSTSNVKFRNYQKFLESQL